MGKTYWLLSSTEENFRATRDLDFSLQGVDTRQRRKAVRMAEDDRMIFYISNRQAFAASTTLTSNHFEDHERIWKTHRESEDFPHRVKMRADVVVEEEKWVDARQIGPRLEYVRKWPPEMWPLALVGTLHIIPQRDFTMLEGELKRVVADKPVRRRGRGRRGRRGRRNRGAPGQRASAASRE
ncbi:MAG: EVE domain-containing protein [Dehalococcoidia bacterium]|jgi:predicted RNA-binding protein|nr:EVE domain-containing protein [Dehalococcoidia bacterium]